MSCFKLVCLGACVAVAAYAAADEFGPITPPATITPVLVKPSGAGCRSVTIDSANAVGVMTMPLTEQTTMLRILHRSGSRADRLTVTLMNDDAVTLRNEIAALVQKKRRAAIRFMVRMGKNDDCEVYQVIG